jgi:4'-phosphopantetheinyl transferase
MVSASTPEPVTVVEVWWIHPHELAPSIASELLDDADQRALSTMQDDSRAAARRSARAVLRMVAARQLDCHPLDVRVEHRCTRCGSDEHGRPFVAGAPFALSSAMTRDIAVVAAGGARMGIDVVARSDAAWAHDSVHAALMPDAVEALESMPASMRDEASLSAVAQVEAYAKANGKALSAVAGKIPVSLDPLRPRIALRETSLVAARVDPDDVHVAVLVIDPAPTAVQVRHATQLFQSHVRSV